MNKQPTQAGAAAALQRQASTTVAASKPKYRRVSLPEIDGWLDPKEETHLEGKLLGWKKFRNDRDEQQVIILAELVAPAKAMVKGEVVTLKPGQTIGMTLRAGLMPLLDYIEHKAGFELTVLGKRQIGGGRTLWAFDVGIEEGARPGKKPDLSEPAAHPPADDVDADEIPF